MPKKPDWSPGPVETVHKAELVPQRPAWADVPAVTGQPDQLDAAFMAGRRKPETAARLLVHSATRHGKTDAQAATMASRAGFVWEHMLEDGPASDERETRAYWRAKALRKKPAATAPTVGKLPVTDPGYWAQSGAESGHQKSLFAWAAIEARTDDRLALLFAIPNGGKRDAATAARMKAEGVRAGVPDVFLPVRAALYKDRADGTTYVIEHYGLFIEMKVGKGRLSDEQKEWLFALDQQGYKCETCYSWIEARDAINSYLGR